MFDFGIGSTELILIGIVALIVIGPRDLPKVLRTVGQVMTKVRSMAREFQGHIEDAAKEAGLDDLKKDINKATNFSTKDLMSDVSLEPTKSTKPSTTDASSTASDKADTSKPEDTKAS